MGGGCAVMGMPQGTGPEQLDLAVQADERTLQGGGTLEQNGRARHGDVERAAYRVVFQD